MLFQAQEQFGFPFQTECDGEVIMHLYNKGGIQYAAQHLDGVFAFILLDVAERKVYQKGFYKLIPLKMRTKWEIINLSTFDK